MRNTKFWPGRTAALRWSSQGVFIATQLNSTELNSTSSWVELCHYKHPLSKCQLFKALNAIFSKVGRFASEAVVLNLIRTKCLPILMYDVESCPLVIRNKTSFTVTRNPIAPVGHIPYHSYSLAYETGSVTVISDYQKFFGFLPIPYQIDIRTAGFLEKIMISLVITVFACCSSITPKLVEIKFPRRTVTSSQWAQTRDVSLMNCSVSHS